MDEGSDEKYIVWLDSDEMLYTRSWKMEMEGVWQGRESCNKLK